MEPEPETLFFQKNNVYRTIVLNFNRLLKKTLIIDLIIFFYTNIILLNYIMFF